MKKFVLAGLTSIALTSGSAFAHDDDSYNFSSEHCSVNVNYGVVVEEQHIRFIDKDQTIIQINDGDQLFVKGKQVRLTSEQKQLLSDYADAINEQVPNVVNLANEAIGIAFTAISHVATAFSGEDTDNSEKLEKIFARIEQKVAERFNKDQGSYYVAQQDFDEFDRFIEDELEAEIEGVVSSFVGDILIAAGTAMTEGDGSFEENMEAFGEKMEKMGEDIESTVEEQAEDLEKQAEDLCQNLKELDDIEQRLTDSVDELNDIDLISVGD
ncbi:DUF2884 family protein [Thalassotalea sp. HSM 43]|uniref:YggN family protein n=1 Tax=Thalassotalea sp. HSM 43 TaxID=2552945 RepID=UPI001080D1F7|nr:YggN family protein [Thalassotalea sp. HSM 43]QBY03781.1 DUF2884 family protein [Thalassotalea sp. HSM 43]